MSKNPRFASLRFALVLTIVFVAALGLELKRSESRSVSKSAAIDDCRRKRKPLKPGEFQLDGIWLDHRNNHKVRITQNGSNLRTADVSAVYVDPLGCPNPNPDLLRDFDGDLLDDKLKGLIYLCDRVPEDTNPVEVKGCKNKGTATFGGSQGNFAPGDMTKTVCVVNYYLCGKGFSKKSEPMPNGANVCDSFVSDVKSSLPKDKVCCDCYPKCPVGRDIFGGDSHYSHPPPLDLTVAADGKSMSGKYLNPYVNSGVQVITSQGPATEETIYLTLEESFGETYYPNTVVYAKTATKIYADASATSGVKMTVPIGTKMMMEHVILGPDGNPAWYYVTDDSSVAPKWYGFVPAPMVRCPGVDQNRPSG